MFSYWYLDFGNYDKENIVTPQKPGYIWWINEALSLVLLYIFIARPVVILLVQLLCQFSWNNAPKVLTCFHYLLTLAFYYILFFSLYIELIPVLLIWFSISEWMRNCTIADCISRIILCEKNLCKTGNTV